MGKLGILPIAFSRSIAQAAGLRNRIVHEYDEIDETKMHEALQSAIRDIPQYVAYIQQYVQSLNPSV